MATVPPPAYAEKVPVVPVATTQGVAVGSGVGVRVGGYQATANIRPVGGYQGVIAYQGPAPMPTSAATPGPTRILCTSCNQQVTTEVTYKAGLLTYGIGVLLFLSVIGALGCCLIPCCLNGAKDVYHFCPNCKAPAGFYKRA